MAEINFDSIPEEYRNLFIERDGQYTLDIDTLSQSRKSAEDVRKALSARDNERAEAAKLRKQMEELQSRFADIDPERLPDAVEALKRVDELEHERLIAEKKFEEAAEKKYQRQIAELQRQIETLNQAVDERQSQFDNVMSDLRDARINSELSEAFIQAGANPAMVPFILEKEAKKWELDPETRQPVPIEWIDGGKNKITATGSDGKPLTKKEHVDTFLRENQWAALPSRGSNSQHQSVNGASSTFTMSREEARTNNRKYEQMLEQAQKVGETVQFID